MKLSPRETVLGLATVIVALYGGTAFFVRGWIDQWKQVVEAQRVALAQIEEDRQIVEQRDRWSAEMTELSKRLPVYSPEQRVDVDWLSKMDAVATRDGVRINRRQAGEETKIGDLYEMPIECSEFDGTLDAVVHFLFDLQEEGGMLDVRQLLLKPKDGGVLRGRFTLSCAYTREAAATDAKP